MAGPADGAWRARIGTDFKPGKRQRIKVVLQREWQGKYLPSGTGATLDDFRLYGNDEWALVVGWRYRFKSLRTSSAHRANGCPGFDANHGSGRSAGRRKRTWPEAELRTLKHSRPDVPSLDLHQGGFGQLNRRV